MGAITGDRDILDSSAAGPAAIRGGVLRLAGYGIGVAVTVVSAALLFRHLGVEDGGRYVTVMSMVLIVSGVLDFGLTAIGVRELSVLPAGEARALMRQLVGLRVVLSVVGVAVAVGFAAAAGYPGVMVAGTALAGIGTALVSLQSIASAVLTAELRLGWVAALELLRQVAVALCTVLFVVLGAELLAFLAIPLPAGIVVLAVTVFAVRGRVSFAPAFDRSAASRLLRDVLPFAAATALSAVYFRISMVMLSLVSTARETGYFGASFRVVETLLVIPNLLVGAGFPIFARAARDDRERLGYAVQRSFEACVVAGGWLALVLAVGAPFVIDVIAGAEFEPAANVLRLQAGALFVAFAGAAFGYGLLSLRRHRELLLLTGSALALNVVLVPVLGSAHGAEGAAAATLAAELLLTVGAAVTLGRIDPVLSPDPRVLLRIAPGLAAGALLGLLEGVPDAALMLAATVAYVGLGLAFRAVPDELLVELRAWSRRLRPRPSGS
jgi:O-antigen/teichoic acid export membrane protein